MECDDLSRPYLYHAMADGSPEIAFHYRGRFSDTAGESLKERPLSYIMGQSDTFSRQMSYSGFGVFGAYLYPYSIPEIFSVPACELNNHVVCIKDIIAAGAVALEDGILLAQNTDERVRILSDFLIRQIQGNGKSDTTIKASIQYIMQAKGRVDMKSLSEHFCLSARQFERRFKCYSGFSPKLFSRITRFQFALNEVKFPHKSLTDISYECGYYDQSHFIHDFKEFSGLHPRSYFSGRAEGTELRAGI